MIDISEYVTQILEPIVPVYFNAVPTGNKAPAQFISFIEINATPELEAADTEWETRRLIQVNVWSKSNYHHLVETIVKTLEENDFERTLAYDAPKSDGDSHFNKVIQFVFIDEY